MDLSALTKEEIDAVRSDCNRDLIKYKVRIIKLTTELDFIRKKIKEIEEEKEMLDLIELGFYQT